MCCVVMFFFKQKTAYDMRISDWSSDVCSSDLEQVASKSFDRVVFLGSGPMLGIARECHLKLQELTDGQIICKHDSFLGFRHGPKIGRASCRERVCQYV